MYVDPNSEFESNADKERLPKSSTKLEVIMYIF
jgi:hypothetical protein